MNRLYAVAIHHKGNWLLEENKLIKGDLPAGADAEATVEALLREKLDAKKYDLAPVGSVTLEQAEYVLYLADISAFNQASPSSLSPFSKNALPQISAVDACLFERTQDFIRDCRRVTERLLGCEVNIIMDRPVGTHHPKHPDIVYPINYGYIDGMLSADGEGIDVYLLGIHEPLESAHCKIIAVIRREDDIEDKLAAAPLGMDFSEAEIAEAIHFQEQFYRSSVHKAL